MSRVGNNPIKIPSGVKIAINASQIEVSGKLGKLNHSVPDGISAELKGEELLVKRACDDRRHTSLHGLTRTLLNNMVVGVAEGFKKGLELKGVGYRAATQGNKLTLNLGYSNPKEFDLPEGITAQVEANTKILLTGSDKALLGQTAAQIRKLRPPEPYKGKGIRYEGEHVTIKAGKAAVGSGK